jgi:hypothetical protein
MKMIWKYKLEPETTLEVPFGSKVLHVDCVEGEVYIWCLVNPTNDLTKRKFRVFGTGMEIPYDITANDYIGTCKMLFGGKTLIWHVFEVV